MNKTQLIKSVMSQSGMDEKTVKAVADAIFETMTETLAQGEKMQIAGFGSFHVKQRPAHTARNPKSGETVTVPDTRILSFTPGKTLKEKL